MSATLGATLALAGFVLGCWLGLRAGKVRGLEMAMRAIAELEAESLGEEVARFAAAQREAAPWQ